MASSEEERPWPSSTTFGSLPRKENGMPGMPGGIWSSQSRGSFKLSDQARRNAAREARMGAPITAHAAGRTASTPSPAASEGGSALPFAIPLQPTPKAGRSLSHSQGQRELPLQTSQTHQGGGGQQAPALPLGLLTETEELDTETESELGTPIIQASSHPPIGPLQRTSTYPSHYDLLHPSNNNINRRADTFADAISSQRVERRFEAAFADLNLEQPSRRSQWQTSLGWEDLPNINESRRHSLADIPTRRGSLVGGEQPNLAHVIQAREQAFRPQQAQPSYHNHHQSRAYNTIMAGNNNEDANEQRPLPYVGNERFGMAVPHMGPAPQMITQKPKKHLYIVAFKCSRVGVFYLLDNTGLNVNEGDMVIVEADRGQDCGTVVNARVTQEQARALLEEYNEEQYKWLMMFSRANQPGNVNPNAAVYGESAGGNASNAQSMPTARASRDLSANLKPKAIKRMAAPHEVKMLREKEANEAKAKRMCQQKVFQHRLNMEILEAEFQWDWNKLIFYYYADNYVNFKDLVNDLYKFYKVRLWMSAVNPASFSPNAVGQPPSGIGPGAVTTSGFEQGRQDLHRPEYDNTYAMAYGNDPDPYGAIPPYNIGYNTQVPNYSNIPGMANSFAPSPGNGAPANPTYGHWPSPSAAHSAQNVHASAVPPTQLQFGGMADLQYAKNSTFPKPYTGLSANAPTFAEPETPLGDKKNTPGSFRRSTDLDALANMHTHAEQQDPWQVYMHQSNVQPNVNHALSHPTVPVNPFAPSVPAVTSSSDAADNAASTNNSSTDTDTNASTNSNNHGENQTFTQSDAANSAPSNTSTTSHNGIAPSDHGMATSNSAADNSNTIPSTSSTRAVTSNAVSATSNRGMGTASYGLYPFYRPFLTGRVQGEYHVNHDFSITGVPPTAPTATGPTNNNAPSPNSAPSTSQLSGRGSRHRRNTTVLIPSYETLLVRPYAPSLLDAAAADNDDEDGDDGEDGDGYDGEDEEGDDGQDEDRAGYHFDQERPSDDTHPTTEELRANGVNVRDFAYEKQEKN